MLANCSHKPNEKGVRVSSFVLLRRLSAFVCVRVLFLLQNSGIFFV